MMDKTGYQLAMSTPAFQSGYGPIGQPPEPFPEIGQMTPMERRLMESILRLEQRIATLELKALGDLGL